MLKVLKSWVCPGQVLLMVYQPPGDMAKEVVQTYADAAPDNDTVILRAKVVKEPTAMMLCLIIVKVTTGFCSRSWRFNHHQATLDMKSCSSSNGKTGRSTQQIESLTPSFPVFLLRKCPPIETQKIGQIVPFHRMVRSSI
jgi:hypothetical protein